MRKPALVAAAAAFFMLASVAGAAPVVTGKTQTSVTVGGLSCGTAYRVRVNPASNTSQVTTLNVTTDACSPPPPPPPNTLTSQAPVQDGATLSGDVIWTAVPGGAAPASVYFYVDGVQDANVESVAPYQFKGDPNGRLALPDGQHVLKVESRSSSGALLASDTDTVTFQNAAPPPPPPPPPPAGWPDETNTGLTDPAALTLYMGPASVTQPISDKIITYPLDIDGPGVVISNSRFEMSVPRAMLDTHCWDSIVQDSEFVGDPAYGVENDSIWAACTTIRRVNIHGTGDAIKAHNYTKVYDSYFHDLKVTDTSHNDDVQSMVGSHMIFQHNHFVAPYYQNGTFMLGTENGPEDDNLIDNNLLVGGGYTFRVHAINYDATNIRFTNNHLQHGSYQWGPFSVQADGSLVAQVACSGNVFEDGSPLFC